METFLHVKYFDIFIHRRSSRSEIATVMPLSDGIPAEPSACSSQAVVTAVSKNPARMTSVVIAEDPGW